MPNYPPPAPAGSGLKPVPCSNVPGVIDVLTTRRDPYEKTAKRVAAMGPISGMNAFGIKIVNVSGAAGAQEILMNKDKAFANGPAWSFFIGPFFHRGVMLMDFDEHRYHRRILQAAFTPTALKGYLQEMQPVIAERVHQLPTGQVEMFSWIKQLTLDVALEVFLGVELPRAEADKLNKAFIDTVAAGTALVRHPVPGGRWWRGLRSRKVLEEFFYANIAAKRAHETPDLFSALCHAESEDGDRFTDEDVVNHMIFVLMAAHDTSTMTMSQMVYWTAKNPQWQDRAREQSLELEPEIGFDTLNRFTDLDLIMRESLRMCPPVPAMPRMALKDTEVQGYHIPEGSIVAVLQQTNHRDPAYFTNPDVFDPDRFSPERAEDRGHRMAWSPFGGGAHKCIGLHFGQMEIKTVMHRLLREFEWSVPDDYEVPMNYSALPVPKDNLPVFIHRR